LSSTSTLVSMDSTSVELVMASRFVFGLTPWEDGQASES
jgi:hypothetical protein